MARAVSAERVVPVDLSQRGFRAARTSSAGADAVAALAARGNVGGAHVIAGRYALDAVPDTPDHARGLVAQDQGQADAHSPLIRW